MKFKLSYCLLLVAANLYASDVSVTNGTSVTNVFNTEEADIVNTVAITNVVNPKKQNKAEKYTAALFVINNLNSSEPEYVIQDLSPDVLQEQTDRFRNILSARLAKTGFNVINPDVVIETLRKANIPDDRNLYSKLQEQDTAHQLADIMNADYIIVARLLGLEVEERNYRGSGRIGTSMSTYTLYTGYEVMSGYDGASFLSGVSEPQRRERVTDPKSEAGVVKTFSNNRMLRLYSDAAGEIADEIQDGFARLKKEKQIPSTKDTGESYFLVDCVLADLSMLPVTMPLFWVNNDGTIGIPEDGVQNVQIFIDGVDVEIDGITVGTSGELLESKPGIHKLKVNRSGMDPVVKTVNFKKKMTKEKPQHFRFAVSPSKKEMNKLIEAVLFYQNLLERNKTLDGKLRLNDAEAKALEGYGKMLEQSGFRIDIAEKYAGRSPNDGVINNWYGWGYHTPGIINNNNLISPTDEERRNNIKEEKQKDTK